MDYTRVAMELAGSVHTVAEGDIHSSATPGYRQVNWEQVTLQFPRVRPHKWIWATAYQCLKADLSVSGELWGNDMLRVGCPAASLG
jgi:hypothetical protein